MRILVGKEALIKAFHRWMEVTSDTNSHDLEDFLLHCNLYGSIRPSLAMISLSEESAQRLQLILSPHYATIIKAWKIQNATDNV